MKNLKQRHMQDSVQQHIHPPIPPIVIYFRQLSSDKFNICPDFGWYDYVVKATPLYQLQNICSEARPHHNFCTYEP